MKEELYIFILWKNALYKKEDILNDIKGKFDILDIYNVSWSDDKYSENLSRFYGTKLPNGSHKEKHCGRGDFLLVIVKDRNPKFEYRETSSGKDFVNVNMFDSKTKYREMTGGGHKVHCSNNIEETDHDLTLLIGKNSKDYLENLKNKFDGNIKELKRDLAGSNGFSDVDEMFYILNNCVKYVILRNYENFPEEIIQSEHSDVDLLCYSRENVAYVLNAKKCQAEDYRSQYIVKIDNKDINFDLRYVGDNYYDEYIEKRLLENRILDKRGFYILNKEDYFYTLLYHALIHKYSFGDDYKNRLLKMNSKFTAQISDDVIKRIKFLEEWMIKNNYIIKKPIDNSVVFNEYTLNEISRLVYRNDTDVNYRDFELEELRKCNNNLNDELNFIKNSRTWRYTKYIRNIASKIRNKLNIK